MANREVDIHFNSDFEADFVEPVRFSQEELIFDARIWRCNHLLHFIAGRILGGSEQVLKAVENCRRSASVRAPRFENEGAFRSWLVRVLIDEALVLRRESAPTATPKVLCESVPEQALRANDVSDRTGTIRTHDQARFSQDFSMGLEWYDKSITSTKGQLEMSEANKRETSYILGHSEAEIIRLQMQAKILHPITERLLRSAGIRPGMRVLDLGSGAGDVAMLAAQLVGPAGWVVGIDRNSQVLSIAKERANRSGFKHLTFYEAAVETFADDAGFDLVIGRYVLIHQTDPVAFLRAAARLARPGGSMALHELRLREAFYSVPKVPLWEMIDRLLRLAFSSAVPHYDAGERLIEHFAHAGLPEPNLFCETHVWGAADVPYYAWAVDTLRVVLPQLQRLGIVAGEFMGIETLEKRLRDAVRGAHSQVTGAPQICAWIRT